VLVDNKFIYLSLPRCASTAFHVTCLKMGIPTLDFTDKKNTHLKDIDIKSKSVDWLADNMNHGHWPVYDLEEWYGKHLPIIAVNRNRHERFISIWQHIIDEMNRKGEIQFAKICSSLYYDDILFFDSKRISDKYNTNELVNEFCIRYGVDNPSTYAKWSLSIAFTPYSFYHYHYEKIIWFEFNELYKMEEWVSNKLNREFKLERGNSSKHYDCNLKISDSFIERYNSIYDVYDFPNYTKTLI
jgi:hypothetical protein